MTIFLGFEKSQVQCSVVIPAYNASATVIKCVTSVLEQGLKRIEVIVVDDGSTDGTVRKIREAFANDGRVRLMCQKQQGPSSARNTGMTLAEGKYLMFLDSDDWLEPSSLLRLINELESSNADALRAYFRYVFPDGSFRSARTDFNAGLYVGQSEVKKLKLGVLRGEIQGFIPLWVFKRDLIQHLRFPADLNFMEDVVFLSKALDFFDRVVVSKSVALNYFQSHNSLTRSSSNLMRNLEDGLSVIKHFEMYDPSASNEDWMHILNVRLENLARMFPLAYRDGYLGFKGFREASTFLRNDSRFIEYLELLKTKKRLLGASSILFLIQRERYGTAWYLTRALGALWKAISFIRKNHGLIGAND